MSIDRIEGQRALRGRRTLALAVMLAATALPAEAIVVSQRAVAESLVVLFLGFAAIVFLAVLGLAAVLGKRGQRAARLRPTLIAFPAAGAAAAAVLWGLSGRLSSSEFEHAWLLAALLLIAIALVLVVQAYFASRRT